MPRRRSLSTVALAVALCVAAGACSDAGEDGEPTPAVCPPDERRALIAEKLTRGEPSSPFTVAAGEEAWASVVEDVDYNPSALFPTIATLFLIQAGAEPQVREDANGLPIFDDPAVPEFDAEGEWRPVTAEPGEYRLWSRRGPSIEVVACPAGAAPG